MAAPSPTSFSTDSIRPLYQWEQIEGWRLLMQHFELADAAFSFVVVFAPDDWAIALIREHLTEVCGGSHTLERLRFDPAAGPESLSQSLLAIDAPSVHPPIVWVDADPCDAEQTEERADAWQQALTILNRYRNTLQKRFHGPLALALPSRMEQIFRAAAPDLWSIRSGVFRIEPVGSSYASLIRLPDEEHAFLRKMDRDDSGDPAVTLAEAAKLRGKSGREVLLAALLHRAGNQARNRLDWPTAKACLEEAYSLQAIAGADPGFGWDIANDLALVLFETADFDRAEYYLRQALQIVEDNFGPASAEAATGLNNLAQLLQDTNRLNEAEPLLRRALEIAEKVHGAAHPTVAIFLSNLATLLQHANRMEDAENCLRRALSIDVRTFGRSHPNIAIGYSNLGRLLHDMNLPREAEPLLRRALAIDEAVYGPGHPLVATRLNNLGGLLRTTNRLAEAEQCFWRALIINEQTYGSDHPAVASVLNNLGHLLRLTNRLKEAESFLRRALTILEGAHGLNHPRVAAVLNNLGALLESAGRFAEAESLLRRALMIAEQSFGPDHPKVRTTRENLKHLLDAQSAGK